MDTELVEMITDGHLGGYIREGDPDTYYPAMWGWLVSEFEIESVLDVGCGDGIAMNVFRELGCEVAGIDGMPQDDPAIIMHDYTSGPYVPEKMYDLIWCCEFVEHVEEKYIANFLATFSMGRIIAMTSAQPGQAGWHHVNCQTPEYWARQLATINRLPFRKQTEDARALAHMYFAATGQIFG